MILPFSGDKIAKEKNVYEGNVFSSNKKRRKNMVFLSNGNGEIFSVYKSRIFQGSNGVSEIIFGGPFSSANTVTATFSLPDGTVKEETLLSFKSIAGSEEIFSSDYAFFAVNLPFCVTKCKGDVGVQFKVYSPSGTLTSETSYFEVEKGVLSDFDATETQSFQDVLSEMAAISEYISQVDARGVATLNGETGDVTIDADDISDENTVNKFVTAADKTAWNAKQSAITAQNKISADLISDGETNKNFTASEKSKLSGIEAGAEVNDVDSVNGKTGVVVLDADDISDTSSNHKFVTASEKSKLSGIEAGAEVNDVDSVNGKTGVVVLDADDISDTLSNHKFVTASEKSKLAAINETWELIEDITLTEAGSISRSITPAGDDYSFKKVKVVIVNAFDSSNQTIGIINQYQRFRVWNGSTTNSFPPFGVMSGRPRKSAIINADVTGGLLQWSCETQGLSGSSGNYSASNDDAICNYKEHFPVVVSGNITSIMLDDNGQGGFSVGTNVKIYAVWGN